MSLSHIYTYRFDGERTLFLGQTTDSDSGGVIESLASEIKNLDLFLPYIVSSTSAYTPNLRNFSKLWNNSMVRVFYWRSLLCIFHTFCSMEEELGEDFQETWFRVNPNAPTPFTSDITNEENE